MNRNLYLANRIREVLLSGKWIANTNFHEQIRAITWQQAIQKVSTLNTVALLTFHINYYLKGLIHVFEGGPLDIKDKFSFDLPEITCEAEWQSLVAEFVANSEAFVGFVEKMEDAQFDQVFVDEKYGTYLRNIEGVIEHSYYHLGQVSLINKLIRTAIQ